MIGNRNEPSGKVAQSSEFKNFEKAFNIYYKWIISDLNSNIYHLKSPLFSNGIHSGMTGHLVLEQVKFSDLYYLQILVNSNYGNKIHGNCKIQLLNTSPDKTHTWQKDICFTSGIYFNCCRISLSDVLNIENGFLQNGNFAITCDIRGLIDISLNFTIPKCSLSKDLELIRQQQNFCDVTLCVSGRDFQAHKVILAARSPVFNAMFNHEMKESKENRVEITDIDSEAFEQFLSFIYTGEVLNLKDFASELLPAANKYDIGGLTVLCENELCTNISIESASNHLMLADIYNLKQLKIVAIGYISSHAVDVIKTEGWNEMILLRSYLVTEVVGELAQLLQFKQSV